MRVLVIGAGISGLTCAIRLLESGHHVVVASDKRTPNVTSDRAGAAFTPYRAGGDERLPAWTRTSLEMFNELERRSPRDTGVRSAPYSAFFYEPYTQEPWWLPIVGGGKFLKSIPSRYAWGVRVRVPMIDMRRYMQWLEFRVRELQGNELQGSFDEVRFTSLAEAAARNADVIVNTSGLGAREIVPDPLVRPIKGQIVSAPNSSKLFECFADSGRAGESTYVFPFEDRIVIGGTTEPGIEDESVDENTLTRIVERARNLLEECGQPRAHDLAQKRIATWAGIRPARVIGSNNAAIRLEMQRLPGGKPVVHDYGHGSVGVTLSWGCADEVLRLVKALR